LRCLPLCFVAVSQLCFSRVAQAVCWQAEYALEAIQAREKARGVRPADRTRIFLPKSVAPKAVALALHGLNHKPSSMDEIAGELADQGIAVVRGGLSGHGGDFQAILSVSREIWQNETHSSWCLAKELATPAGLPVFGVAFSLGALQITDLVTNPEYSDVEFSRVVMLAPAISIRWYPNFMRILRPFPKMVIPSVVRPEIRANRSGTSGAAYTAMFDSVDAVESKGIQSVPFPALILMDRDDEVVSDTGTEALVAARPKHDWKIEFMRAGDDATLPASHHSIFESRLVGKTIWRGMMDRSVAFLLGTNQGTIRF
jgi:alpha-beta hydrolase superfamily lysophospholipase